MPHAFHRSCLAENPAERWSVRYDRQVYVGVIERREGIAVPGLYAAHFGDMKDIVYSPIAERHMLAHGVRYLRKFQASKVDRRDRNNGADIEGSKKDHATVKYGDR